VDILEKLAKCGVPATLLCEVAGLQADAEKYRHRLSVEKERQKKHRSRDVTLCHVTTGKISNEINGSSTLQCHVTKEKEKERKVPPITPLKKEREREKDISVKFDEFWQAYPRRVAKLAALRAFKKALSKGTEASVIITGASRYGEASRDKDPEYIKHPSTWLNGGCWEDFSEPTAGDINAERQRRVQEFLRQREQANGSGVEKAGNGLHREPAKGSPNGASDDPPWLTRVG